MTTKVYDAIVIGAGVNGSSAALHLAKKGKNTALLEQFPLPHSRGSSTGQSRIIRYGNTSPEAFLPIIIDAYKQWKDLEQETQTALLRPCPLYTIAGTAINKNLQKMYKSSENAGQNPRWRTGHDLNEEYGTSFNPDYVVVEELNSGVLMASKCLLALQKRFVELGGTILDEFPITKVSAAESGRITVEGPKGIVEGDHLVICAGPWSSGIFEQLGIGPLPLRPQRVDVCYWKLKELGVKPFNFITVGNGVPLTYGLPSVEYPEMLKICVHHGFDCDPDRRDCATAESKEECKEALRKFIDKNFPFLESRQPAIIETCIYTESPDNQMILDQHPKHKNISYGCGFSGMGFKTGPSVGKILADLALGINTFDIADFRSDRFKLEEGETSQTKL